jgi:hypothetical protein
MVLFDKGTYDKLYKEVPMYKLITPSVISERLKVCVVVCVFIICTLNNVFILFCRFLILILSRFPGTRFTRKTGIEGVDGKE